MVALLVLLTIITFLTIDFFAQRAEARRTVPATATRPVSVQVPLDLGTVPAGLFLSRGHAWMGVEPSGVVRVGADRLPSTLLGGVEAVTSLPVGTEVHRGEPIARLHHGDRSVELASPVDGVVTAANPEALNDPGAVAADPFGRGWIAAVEPRGLGAALKRLFVAEEAASWMRAELSRLRDFLVGLDGGLAAAAATLPDGGLPMNGVAKRLNDGEWRELAARFFTDEAA
jgi:glycine cleavage system H lipoate-binding protein